MKNLWLVLCLVCLLSSVALAQTKTERSWKCDKAKDSHSINVGDKPGHAYVLDQINCASTKGEIEGVRIKSGMGTELLEINGDKVTGHGVFMETLANGDKNSYSYQLKGTMKNGAFQSGSDTWVLQEGTGKSKGAKSNGTCKGTGAADGSVTWDCAGDVTAAKK